MFYTEIKIKGKLDQNLSDWFESLQVLENPTGDTVIFGNLPDRSAVYGVISRLSSLGITLISVSCQEECETSPLD
jgi:hypothetical protein